ncbi:hypothetical protein EJB05_19054, partial [Eragrostis curvula]
MKHLDKFYNKSDVPWVKLIWSTYYEDEVPHYANEVGSFWWKDVFRLNTEYRGIATCRIGKGDTVSLWHDMINGSILSQKYPRLYSFSNDKYGSLHKAMNAESFEEIFHLPLSNEAYEELLDMQLEIENMDLPYEDDDIWSYIWGSVSYSSSKFYKHQFNGLENSPLHQRNWKSKCMPKIKFFVWQLLIDRVSTRNMLRRRNHFLESGYNCVMCNRAVEETAVHLFFECPYSVSCWFSIGILWDEDLEIHEKIKKAKLEFQYMFFTEIFSTAAWNIWKQRNAKIFNNKQPSVASWKRAFKEEVLMHLHRIKESHHQAIQDWLQLF